MFEIFTLISSDCSLIFFAFAFGRYNWALRCKDCNKNGDVLKANLDEMAASPHGAVEMYMCSVTSFFSFNLRPIRSEGIASNKLSTAPGPCDNKFRYKNLKSKTVEYYWSIITATQRSCGKVMFSKVSSSQGLGYSPQSLPLLRSSGHHWRPIQTCSLEDTFSSTDI